MLEKLTGLFKRSSETTAAALEGPGKSSHSKLLYSEFTELSTELCTHVNKVKHDVSHSYMVIDSMECTYHQTLLSTILNYI